MVRRILRKLYDPDPRVRWEAVRDLGAHAERLWPEKPEAVRELVRRFVWSMSEEAGASPWGAPEAMGEILRRVPPLREGFGSMYSGYLEHEEMVLDHEVLDAGALWAVGTLGPEVADPEVYRRILPRFLSAPGRTVRVMAARAARSLGLVALVPDGADEGPPVLCLEGEEIVTL
jgi:hypothetical protein